MSQGQAAPSAALFQDLPELAYHLQIQDLEVELQRIPKHQIRDRGIILAKIGILQEKIRQEGVQERRAALAAAVKWKPERPRRLRFLTHPYFWLVIWAVGFTVLMAWQPAVPPFIAGFITAVVIGGAWFATHAQLNPPDKK